MADRIVTTIVTNVYGDGKVSTEVIPNPDEKVSVRELGNHIVLEVPGMENTYLKRTKNGIEVDQELMGSSHGPGFFGLGS